MQCRILQSSLTAAVYALALLASSASAASLVEQFGKLISDDEVKSALNFALSSIHKIDRAKCGECGPATAEERSNPPISLADGRTAMALGIVTAFAQPCGMAKRLEPQKNAFIGMPGRSRRQVVLLGIMSGVRQKQEQDTIFNFGGGRPCSDKMRAQLEESLARKP